MSEVGFTRGPWFVRFGNIGHVKAENGALIAKCQRLTSLCNLQANAHLIAAAPDLYEALDACLGLILSQEMQDGFESQQGHMARAALAKARGETP